MTEPLLQIRNLTCERDGRPLFADLNLHLAAGQLVELTGPNGSGKSTLLRCVTGLYPDYSGSIESAPFNYLGHKPGISPLLTAQQNLRWYAGLAGSPGTGNPVAVTAALERVGLAGYELSRCQNLSAGQQRRVALARLLVGASALWLLDEPFTALDSAGHALVRELLAEQLAQGGAVLCATHQPLEVAGSGELKLGAAA